MKAGDKLWRVPTLDRHISTQEYEVKVESVGRIWAKLSNGERCRIEPHPYGGHVVDGGEYTSRASMWPDRATYAASVRLSRAWFWLERLMHQHPRPPSNMTAERINEARKILFGDARPAGEDCV